MFVSDGKDGILFDHLCQANEFDWGSAVNTWRLAILYIHFFFRITRTYTRYNIVSQKYALDIQISQLNITFHV